MMDSKAAQHGKESTVGATSDAEATGDLSGWVPEEVTVDGDRIEVRGQRASDLEKDSKNYAPPNMVIPGIAAAGRVTMIAAREKLGKSTFAAFAAVEVSRGGELWGEEVEAGLVLWIGLEEDRADALARFIQMGANTSNIIMLDSLHGAVGIKRLKAEVMAFKPKVVVLDSLAAYASGQIDDENGAPGWTRELTQIVELARHSRAAFLILHHANKGTGAYRGSTAIGANMDMIIEMASSKDDSSLRTLTTRGRWELESFEVRYDRDSRAFSMVRSGASEMTEDQRRVEDLKHEVLDWLAEHPGAKSTDIRKGVGGRGSLVDQAVKALLSEGRIQHLGRGNGYQVPILSDGGTLEVNQVAA